MSVVTSAACLPACSALTEGVGAGLEGQTGAIYTETAAQRTDSDL